MKRPEPDERATVRPMSGDAPPIPGDDDERRRERRLWVGLGVASAVAALLFGPGLVHLSERQMEMEAARWPSTWKPVASAMVSLAERVPAERRAGAGDAWVPEAIRHLHGRVDAAPGRVTVTFGDPAHRFGYRLVPAPGRLGATHLTWYLNYFSYRLDSPKLLETITGPVRRPPSPASPRAGGRRSSGRARWPRRGR